MEQPIKVVQGYKKDEVFYLIIIILGVVALMIFSFYSGMWFDPPETETCFETVITPITE